MRTMLPEVKSSSEVYGETNIGGKGGTVFLLPVWQGISRWLYLARCVMKRAWQKTSMEQVASC